MQASLNWVVIFYVGIFLLGVVVTYIDVRLQKAEICKVLGRKGAQNIRVSWEPIDFDQSNHTYTVEYEDLSGTKHRRSCKIHILGSEIYWGDEN